MNRRAQTATDRWRFSATVLLPTVLALILTATAVGTYMMWSTRDIDKASIDRQTRLATGLLDAERINLSHEQRGLAYWDDAIDNLEPEFNASWLQDRIIDWNARHFGHDFSAILDSQDQARLTQLRNIRMSNFEFEKLYSPAVAPLVQKLRNEIAHGAIDAFLEGRQQTPPSVRDYVLLDGRPAIVSVSPFIPMTLRPDWNQSETHILVSAVFLNSLLGEIFTDAVIYDSPEFTEIATPPANRASLPLIDSKGRIIAFFQWTPQRPGTALLTQTGPIVGVSFVIGALMIFLLMSQLRRSSRAVDAARLQAEHDAYHDRLTGLINRTAFEQALERRLSKPAGTRSQIDLFMLDLDRFKQVNDTLGHQAGDELIRQVGARLRRVVGPDVKLARLGGDEFAILSLRRSAGHAPDKLSNRIIEAIGEPYLLGQNRAFVGVSIGIVSTTLEQQPDSNELLRKADIALYDAKERGRNRATVYEDHMDELVQNNRLIEGELREALARGKQISAVFQPLIDARTRTIIGAEALARWHHPVHGPISPGRFIAVAESTGQIEALGEVILRRACALGASLPGLLIAVNISTAQLRNPGFAELVFGVLQETGMRPEDLELEITESILLDEQQVALQQLRAFRAAGIQIALDDFGTGYSSLSYLRRYPVDRIKIDRSFVNHLAPGHANVAITQAIVSLAHAMQLHVTAEGVETTQQADILEAMGCNILQGFLFSGGVPEKRLMDMIAARTAITAPQQPEARQSAA